MMIYMDWDMVNIIINPSSVLWEDKYKYKSIYCFINTISYDLVRILFAFQKVHKIAVTFGTQIIPKPTKLQPFKYDDDLHVL